MRYVTVCNLLCLVRVTRQKIDEQKTFVRQIDDHRHSAKRSLS